MPKPSSLAKLELNTIHSVDAAELKALPVHPLAELYPMLPKETDGKTVKSH